VPGGDERSCARIFRVRDPRFGLQSSKYYFMFPLSRSATFSSRSARIAFIAVLTLTGPELFHPLSMASFSFSLN